MTEREQVEKAVDAVFSDKRLDWVIALIEENRASGTWAVEVEIPNGPELILSVPKGSLREMKQSVRQQAEEEIDRLSMHR
jgi:hypothetical protein